MGSDIERLWILNDSSYLYRLKFDWTLELTFSEFEFKKLNILGSEQIYCDKTCIIMGQLKVLFSKQFESYFSSNKFGRKLESPGCNSKIQLKLESFDLTWKESMKLETYGSSRGCPILEPPKTLSNFCDNFSI